MSLIITSIIVAGGVLLGRFIGTRGSRPSGDEKRDPSGAKADQAASKNPPADPFDDYPCKLGDVLIRSGGEEAWLAGALTLSEGGKGDSRPTAVLFVAPEAKRDVAIFVRTLPAPELSWLLPVDPAELAVGPEPPTSIEHLGARFERQRRTPLRAERVGTGAPDVGEQVIVAEYTSSGSERLVVLAGSGTAHAWRGTALEDGMYEVIPSGKATL